MADTAGGDCLHFAAVNLRCIVCDEFIGVSPAVSPGELVTCDDCPATSESGWGDTPLCLDCQRKADSGLVCEEHLRTFEDECPLEHEVVHKLIAYTFFGRRGECAVTEEFLPSVNDWDYVTCPACLRAKPE